MNFSADGWNECN